MSLTTQQALRSLLGEADREALRATFGDAVRFDEPLAPYTSWKIGGPADAVVTTATQAELANLMRLCLRRKLPWWIVGGGSNVLVGDGGMRGIVIRLAGDFAAVEVHLDCSEVTGQPDDDAAHSSIADEHVASAADDPPRQLATQTKAHQVRQLRLRRGRYDSIGRSADLPRSIRRKWLVESHCVAEGRTQCFSIRFAEKAAQRLLRGKAHPRAAAARRPATSVMFPAPSIRTMAPAGTSSRMRVSSSSTHAT